MISFKIIILIFASVISRVSSFLYKSNIPNVLKKSHLPLGFGCKLHMLLKPGSNDKYKSLSFPIKHKKLFIKSPDLSFEYGTSPNSLDQSNLKNLFKPEILAPAGGWPQLRAAVANGADAVYFGLQDGFNARARATNFAIEELPEVMNYLHDHNLKGYLVVNILVFDDEIRKLKELIPKIAISGVDALIMQDLGAASLVHSIAPNLPIHGSTQMSITDTKGVEFTQRLNLGIDRVVVGRELSIGEIKMISNSSDVELEAFVHG